MRPAIRTAGALAATALVLTLAGCGRDAANANAPESPATGNPAQAVAPQAPDGPPGGPSGVKGSAPHTGASGADIVPGTTGSGTTNAAGQEPAQHGGGLHGGLAGSQPADTQAMGAADGTANKRSATGNP
jgi:hypothetical protein